MSALRPLRTSRWGLVLLLVAGLALTSSCGDDEDPTRPEDDGILEVPGEFPSLHQALDAAPNGSTIRIDAVSLQVDSALGGWNTASSVS